MQSRKAERRFIPIAEQIAGAAKRVPDKIALIDADSQLTFAELVDAMGAIGASLAANRISKGDVLAICAQNSVEYALLYLAATARGIIVAPLPAAATPESLLSMLGDCQPKALLVDETTTQFFPPKTLSAHCPTLQLAALKPALDRWKSKPTPSAMEPIRPDDIFNIIYSSGTTGTPKGIVQTHAMRDAHVQLGQNEGHDEQAVNLLSTPLYSNTTLISFFPTVALGGTTILMSKFDCGHFLALAAQHGVTHTMLVPVQYMRLMDYVDFDSFDLGSFRQKYCTSAPFPADLKREILDRWPGGLTEYYGMTEGGGLCVLRAHEQRDKLATVGQPAADCDMRIIDEDGQQLPPTCSGEIVGHSGTMMHGYLNRPELNEQIFWVSPEGKTFIRTGDIGRFDTDGFLYLLDRKKDVIISGGFNIYPVDIENVLRSHLQVNDVAVVGVPSKQWGETPVAFVVAPEGDAQELKAFVNQRVGKMQRIADLKLVDQIPRNEIGKILKRQLRMQYTNEAISL
ncbi:MAG: class I adenylate-forming enzyme family protein [Steroidobacteraceae bacterium]